jgi:hypothetical protein
MVLVHGKVLGARCPGGASSGYIDDMSDGDDEDSDQNEESEEEVRGQRSLQLLASGAGA